MSSFAKADVIELITNNAHIQGVYKNYEYAGNRYDVYHLENSSTIRLPADNSRIPEREVIQIADVKLDMSTHEIDYWLGEQYKPKSIRMNVDKK